MSGLCLSLSTDFNTVVRNVVTFCCQSMISPCHIKIQMSHLFHISWLFYPIIAALKLRSPMWEHLNTVHSIDTKKNKYGPFAVPQSVQMASESSWLRWGHTTLILSLTLMQKPLKKKKKTNTIAGKTIRVGCRVYKNKTYIFMCISKVFKVCLIQIEFFK